jgi:MoaA/NifB/PqqE/SkfB family radical SAM enzyme
MLLDIIKKEKNREKFTFANINLLGKCNVNCYFCLGKDIEELLSLQNQLTLHFTKWQNFRKFLKTCERYKIKKLYLTGQNTDALLYKYFDELVEHLKKKGFQIGIRTNGYLAKESMGSINKCNGEIGYSIHSIDPQTNYKIMGRKDMPDWDYILKNTQPKTRVSIVVNRYNFDELFNLIKYLSNFKNVAYIQARRISTETRYDFLKEDIELYEELYKKVAKKYSKVKDFYKAQIFNIYGKDVIFWRCAETSINCINYFTDGTLSEEYFVVEGYLKQFRDTTKT